MDAGSVIAEVQQAEKSCTKAAQKLPIHSMKIGTAAERNQVQKDNGWKPDGIKGRNYLILSTKYSGRLMQFASFGPLVPNVTADDFKVLLKSKICMVDES
jgi:hypothetical protein